MDGGGVERRSRAIARRPRGEQPVLEGGDVLDSRPQVVAVEVAEADRQRPADLVAVAGPDPAARRADRPATRQAGIQQLVFGDVPGENDVGPVADLELAGHRHPARLEHLDLADGAGGVEHDPPGDHALHAGAKDAAGDQRQLPGLAAGDDGVAGVGTAGVADDDVVLAGEDVDELPLGLVTPLQTDDTGAGHGETTSRRFRLAEVSSA